jgi:hypothetical protein
VGLNEAKPALPKNYSQFEAGKGCSKPQCKAATVLMLFGLPNQAYHSKRKPTIDQSKMTFEA